MKRTIKPNFVVVGAQKCGTTSIYNYLNENPAVFVPHVKETNFFSDSNLFDKGKAYYLSKYFNSNNRYKIVGEVCPAYLSNLNAPERIYKTFGKIKIVIILRNPIDRAYSNFIMRRARQQEQRSFEEAVNSEIEVLNGLGNEERVEISPGNDYLYNSLYARHIRPYIDLFGFDSICFLSFDKLCMDSRRFMDELYDFLGCKQNVTNAHNKKYNVASRARSTRLELLIRNDFRFKSYLKSIIPSSLKNRIIDWNSLPIQKDPIPEKTRQKLDLFFRDENYRLAKMLNGIVKIEY